MKSPKGISSFLIFALPLFWSLESGLSQNPAPSNYFNRGREARDSGQWQKALEIWAYGKKALAEVEKVDPRIGFAFIETATQHKATSYYQLACNLYDWVLTLKDFHTFEKSFAKEIKRLRPILHKDQYTSWVRLLNRNDSLLTKQMQDFWRNKDPTPTTPTLNERLLEHWERIAYARKHFNKSKNTIYGTDDRGPIYIKYGKPDILQTGKLGTNRLAFKRWTDVLEQMHRTSRQDQERFLRLVDRYNSSPEFEIWIYYSLGTEKPIFYLFGRQNGTGSFGLRNGIEEFIPAEAFRRTSSRFSLLPGSILQTIYYGELVHLNDFFANRLRELDQAWENFERSGMFAISRSQFRNIRNRFVLLGKERLHRYPLPADFTTFDQDLALVVLTIQPVRLLNAQNKPEISCVILSSTQFHGETARMAYSQKGNYFTIHTLKVLDSAGEETDRFVNRMGQNEENISTFTFPHDSSIARFNLIAEVFQPGDSGQALAEKFLDNVEPMLVGYNEANFASDPPLNTNPDSLELSDLIIGVSRTERAGKHRLRFPVIPAIQFWQAQNLRVYLEIYHLLLDQQGLGHFNINLRVARFRGRSRSRKEMISLSFNYDSASRTAKEHFGVDISNLPPGNYELKVEVKDELSQQVRDRVTQFKILDTEDLKN